MEDFSTPRRAPLLWVTDLATITLVVAAVGWSGAQRPEHGQALAQHASASAQATPVATFTVPAPKPALTAPLSLDALLAGQSAPLLSTDGSESTLRSVAFKLPATR